MHDLDRMILEFGVQLIKDLALRFLLPSDLLIACGDLFAWRATVYCLLRHPGTQLLLEATDALHKEFVEIRTDNGQELQAFQQRIAWVLGFA